MVESTQDGCGCDLSPSRRLAYRPGVAFGKAFRDLLGSPFVGGRSGDSGMQDTSGVQFDDYKDDCTEKNRQDAKSAKNT